MKRAGWIRGGALALPAAVLLVSGCGDENPAAPDDALAAGEAAGVATAAVLSMQTGTSGLGVALATRRSLAPAPAPLANEFDLTCPVVSVTTAAGSLHVRLDYGDGCTSQLDQQLHAGALEFSLSAPGFNYQVVFMSYATGGYLVTGGLTGAVGDSTATMTLSHLSLAGPTGTMVVDGSLAGTWHDHGSPLELTDDTWEIRGNATVLDTDQTTYVLTIADEDPVILVGSCRWPVSGRIAIRKGQSPLVTVLDFGDGACDDEVTLAAAGQSRTIHLPDGREG